MQSGGRYQPAAVGLPKRCRLGQVVLVLDRPDQLLRDVLQRDHSSEAAVLVDDAGELATGAAQLLQDRAQRQAGGQEQHGSRDRTHRRRGPLRARYRQEVGDGHYPDDVIDAVLRAVAPAAS